REAQKLRFQIFFKEGSASANRIGMLAGRDFDEYDTYCDHLLVIDHAAGASVVGTYRLLRQSIAKHRRGFYSSREFDLGPLLGRHPQLQFLELGRSCVLSQYRSKRTMELLWLG